jgi:hypothetical protein
MFRLPKNVLKEKQNRIVTQPTKTPQSERKTEKPPLKIEMLTEFPCYYSNKRENFCLKK